jgi:hypothetical protein
VNDISLLLQLSEDQANALSRLVNRLGGFMTQAE